MLASRIRYTLAADVLLIYVFIKMKVSFVQKHQASDCHHETVIFAPSDFCTKCGVMIICARLKHLRAFAMLGASFKWQVPRILQNILRPTVSKSTFLLNFCMHNARYSSVERLIATEFAKAKLPIDIPLASLRSHSKLNQIYTFF